MARFPFTVEDGYRLIFPPNTSGGSSAQSRLSNHPFITFLSAQRRFFLLLLTLFASLFAFFALFPHNSSSSQSYTSTLPPLDTPARRLLYGPQPGGVCSFEPPTYGLSSRERQLLARGRPKGSTDHLGYRGVQGEGDGKVVHPLLGLLKDGEDEFEAMVSRRSETREQAVREYKRRHGRKPPRGFGEWWDYVSRSCTHVDLSASTSTS
jgi:hypothetical protein